MNVSNNIIAIRESKRIKQSEVADKLNMERPNYSRIEKRGVKMTIEQLMQIAEALGVPFIDLLQDADKPFNIQEVEKLRKENEELKREVEDLKDDKRRLKESAKFFEKPSNILVLHKILERITNHTTPQTLIKRLYLEYAESEIIDNELLKKVNEHYNYKVSESYIKEVFQDELDNNLYSEFSSLINIEEDSMIFFGDEAYKWDISNSMIGYLVNNHEILEKVIGKENVILFTSEFYTFLEQLERRKRYEASLNNK